TGGFVTIDCTGSKNELGGESASRKISELSVSSRRGAVAAASASHCGARPSASSEKKRRLYAREDARECSATDLQCGTFASALPLLDDLIPLIEDDYAGLHAGGLLRV